MEIQLDEKYIMAVMEALIETPSPVGYYEECTPLLLKYLKDMHLTPYTDERHTVYALIEGEDTSRTVLVGAHMDTLGLQVHQILPDGTMTVRNLGGNNLSSLDGEKMFLKTLDGQTYTGFLVYKNHSVHVSRACKTGVRCEEDMRFLLDEDVCSRGDVLALGINTGDVLSAEPHFEYMENGRIRSRFIDNKGGVAALLGAMRYITEEKAVPKYNTLFAFPFYEELALGGTYTPDGVREYLAIDIGITGEEQSVTEKDVAILARDKVAPYDRDLLRKLKAKAEKHGIAYAIESFRFYTTDGMDAFVAGNNLKGAAFGMTVSGSHGIERTFDTSIFGTARLTVSYVCDL